MTCPVPPAPPADRRLPRELWILIAAAFVVAVGYGLIAPVLPQFAEIFAGSVTATAAVVSAFAVFRLLGAPPAGTLTQRLGERPVYIAGTLIVAASSAATAFAQSYWQLIVFRALGGIGSVFFTVSAAGLLVKLSPVHLRGKASACYGASFLLGSVLGPVLGGFLAQAGMRVPFLVYAVALSCAAIMITVFMPRAIHASSPEAATSPMSLREAWADPAYRSSLAVGFAHGWSNIGVRIALVPLFIVPAITPQPNGAGFAMAAFALGNTVVLPLTSRFADSVGRKPLIILGALATGLFTALLGFSTDLYLALAWCALAGFGVGAMTPALQAVAADIVGSERSAGRVLATFQMAQDIGSIIGPVAAGLVADHFGYGWTFVLSGMILIVSVTGWLATPDTLPRTVQHRPKAG